MYCLHDGFFFLSVINLYDKELSRRGIRPEWSRNSILRHFKFYMNLEIKSSVVDLILPFLHLSRSQRGPGKSELCIMEAALKDWGRGKTRDQKEFSQGRKKNFNLNYQKNITIIIQ